MSVQELRNNMVSPSEEGRLNEARDTDNVIIISDFKLQNIILLQIKKKNAP